MPTAEDSTRRCRVAVRLTRAERTALDQLAWDRRIELSELVRAGVRHILTNPASAPRRTGPPELTVEREEMSTLT